MGLEAGSAEVDITPQPGVELMGYGAREGVARGVHDPLFARALFLHSEDRKAVLIVSADLCLMAPSQAWTLRERIGSRTGLDPGQILISCTHTHSAPDTGLGALLSGRPEPPHVAALFAGIEAAGVEAVERAAPASLRSAEAAVRIGRNRRLAEGPLDPTLLLVDVRHEDGGPLAVLFHHACHGTVLGHDNLEISADWAGVTARRIARETGALAIFVLGAHADIDPRTRGLMDLAIPGQSRGLGFEAVRVLGEEVASAAIEALAAPGDPIADASVGAHRARLDLPLHYGELPPAEAEARLERRRAELAESLTVDRDAFPRLSELGARAFERARGLPLAEARALLSQTRLYLRDKTAPFFVGGARRAEVEVQAVRLGDVLLLGLPVEPTTNVGLDWKRRVRGRFARAGVAGIANGWLRYLPHADDLAHPRAAEHYEVLESILAPGACERLLDEGEKLAALL